jgi:hypothetical protein
MSAYLSPDDEREFSCMYLAWLQCGMATYAIDEDRERAHRAMMFPPVPDICPHGHSRLRCTFCYFNDYKG